MHLEQALGVPLFQRLHGSLILTARGEALLPEDLRTPVGGQRHGREGSEDEAGIAPALSDEPDRLLARLAGTKRPPDYMRAVATDDVAPAPIPACMPKCWRSRPVLEPTRRPHWWSGPASPAAVNSPVRGRSW